MYNHELKEGLSFSQTITILENQTAKSVGSGNLDVFATPSMIACMENTALRCIAAHLDKGFDTVGTEINTKHFKASIPGEKITFTAKIDTIDDRSILLTIDAANELNIRIGSATHTRFVIEVKRFVSKLKGTQIDR